MATILEFRVQSRSTMTGGRNGGASSAEIVLFPGVRYERWTDETPAPPKLKKSRRRDTLDLED